MKYSQQKLDAVKLAGIQLESDDGAVDRWRANLQKMLPARECARMMVQPAIEYALGLMLGAYSFLSGHQISSPTFTQPARQISAVGG